MSRKISELPKTQFSGEMIDNCFFVDKINTSQMSAIPLKSIFDEIIIRAKKDGLNVELMSDKIVILSAGTAAIKSSKCSNEEQDPTLRKGDVSKPLPIGDVEILLIALEHIAKWGDEEEERWDDPGDCAIDAVTQYRYSMSKGNVC